MSEVKVLGAEEVDKKIGNLGDEIRDAVSEGLVPDPMARNQSPYLARIADSLESIDRKLREYTILHFRYFN